LSATITKSLLSSTRAATFSQVLRMMVTFGTYAVLRRWVDPGSWGIWHWSEPLFLLLGQVRDLGLPGHVVRLKRPRPYGNLLRVELIWGLFAGILVMVGAPQIARFFEQSSQDLVRVVQALALFLFFEGLARVPLTWCEAELQIGRSVPAELARNFTFALVALSLGWYDFGVWSLVIAHVIGSAVFAAVLWWTTWGRMELHFREDGDGPLLKKSLPLVVMSLLVLLTGKIDPWVLGLRFDTAAVGRYGMVLFLSFIIAIYVALPVSRALYPALSGLRHDHRFFGAYRLATLLLLAIETLAALGLFVNAEVALLIFGGEEYVEMAPVLRILCFAPLVQPFSRCANDMLLNLHKDVVIIVSSALTLVSLVGLGYLLSGPYGVAGMAWANLVPLGTLVVTWAVWRVAPDNFWRLVRDLLVVYLVPLPFFGLAWWAGGENLWLRLGFSFLAAAASAAIYTGRHHDEFRVFFEASEE